MTAIGGNTIPCLLKAMVHPKADPASLGASTAGESAAAVRGLRGHPCPGSHPGWEGPSSAVRADRPGVPFLLLGGGPLGRCPFFLLKSGPWLLYLSCNIGM